MVEPMDIPEGKRHLDVQYAFFRYSDQGCEGTPETPGHAADIDRSRMILPVIVVMVNVVVFVVSVIVFIDVVFVNVGCSLKGSTASTIAYWDHFHIYII